jgi:hypothetical protein
MNKTPELETAKGGAVASNDPLDSLANREALIDFVQFVAIIQNRRNPSFPSDEALATDFMCRLQCVAHLFSIPLDDMRQAARIALVSDDEA